MNKPEFISNVDFEILKSMYPNNIDEVIQKLNNHYPVQYLIGNVNFYGYQIFVDERVLIPRFETEGLVEETLKLIKLKNITPKIIEIGTGSGCIAIALSKELNTHVTAIDISKSAIEVATKNALYNEADVTFQLKDIKTGDFNSKYNILISNPPYVKYDEPVDPATKFEPQNALFADHNGLEFYEVILKRSHEFMESTNIIAFEIGETQATEIETLAKKEYPNANVIVKKDLQERNRYLFIIND